MDGVKSLFEFFVTVGGREPLQVARTILLYLIIGYATGRFSKSVYNRGLKTTLFGIGLIVMSKVSKGTIKKEMQKVRRDFERDLIDKHKTVTSAPKFHVLPKNGMPRKQLYNMLEEWSKYDNSHWNGTKRLASGSVYHGGKELMNLQCDIFKLFCVSNPLHPETFPFVRKMESEVIAMVVTMFHGNPFQQGGILTTGGTESIVCAIRAYKLWARETKGITKPELIVANTAHAAFWKGCEMFEVEIKVVQVKTKDCRLDPREIEKQITPNTIAIVGSSPQYAQGVIDPIEELSKIALKHNIGLHVDCCLGSFMIPLLKEMGYDIPPMDFRLPGVTTISCDTHKFGYSTKGTSILMFRSDELRSYTYFTYVDSSIGWYATPTIQGSRSGALIAATWAAMVHLGLDGYKKDFENIMQNVNKIREAIESMDELEIIGDPKMSVLSFRPTNRNVHPFQVSDAMSKRGWTLNNCTMPPCMHICITHATYDKSDKFINDLKESYDDVVNNPEDYASSSGAMYGTMVEIPAGSVKEDILKQYMNILVSPY